MLRVVIRRFVAAAVDFESMRTVHCAVLDGAESIEESGTLLVDD